MFQKGHKIKHGPRKPKNLVFSDTNGVIEDVYGTETSFNIYRGKIVDTKHEFYMSAYSLESAKRWLEEMQPKGPKPKQLQ